MATKLLARAHRHYTLPTLSPTSLKDVPHLCTSPDNRCSFIQDILIVTPTDRETILAYTRLLIRVMIDILQVLASRTGHHSALDHKTRSCPSKIFDHTEELRSV